MPLTKTILYVDDDPDDRDFLREAMGMLPNHTFLTFSCGSDLFDYLYKAQEPICLIILDINMPRQNGAEIAAILQQNKSFEAIPLVMLTTGATSPEAIRLQDSGVPVIEKWVSLQGIVAVANRLVNYC